MEKKETIKPDVYQLEGDAMDRALLAEQLYKWRIRQGLSQHQLAEQWGISRYTLMRAEKARYIAWPMLYRLSARLTESLTNERQQYTIYKIANGMATEPIYSGNYKECQEYRKAHKLLDIIILKED